MAGLFGFFNFEKEGPGVSKDAPKKKNFFLFFELFFRNFGKFFSLNFITSLLSLPLLTNGLAAVGMTNVTRNIAREKHTFGLSDYFETIKKNWKQGLAVGIINVIVYAVLLLDFYFFYGVNNETLGILGLGLSFSVFIVYTIMNFYIWTLMITFNFTLGQLFKNSFKFVFVNFFKNLLFLFLTALIYALYVVIALAFSGYLFYVVALELIVYALTFPAFWYLMIQFCVFPPIKKFIIDPYYKLHPDADIEKRRDLGLEIEEDSDDDEDEEEETRLLNGNDTDNI